MRRTNRLYAWLLLCLFLILGQPVIAREKKERPPVDVRELIMGHLKDTYEWHFFTIGEKDIVLPLPVIVRSRERGWFVFMSSRLEEQVEYKGFYYASGGISDGKIVERNSAGKEVRPFDISITKDVLALFVACGLMIWLVLSTAAWYKKRDARGTEDEVPAGFKGFLELFIMDVHDNIIKKCIGKDYRRYAPYLLTAFFFIFFNNVLGLIPIFPEGANLTGNIAVTLVLALCTFIAVNVFGNRAYWKDILWPEVPLFLKAPLPIMPLIEFFGILTKPMALTIRLFANIFAGHCIILALTSLIFLTVAMGPVISGSMTVVSILFSVFMLCLELLVAYIQAYVFTMLSAVFIGMSRQEHHGEKTAKIIE